ncbi:hypothetical protein FJT64_011960 [Amphibalanus amphitrite]|uniref:Uncharacterized protein n=1 Tax=Amphibalanus amphitrite TaxID=1232801 RepID=A0A6A4V5E1_AMPAM|nr:hypothetical protein FJT64_011960 [Amphibalanus amphitrite]
MKVPTERTYENFVRNQWVAQLYVLDDVLADQRRFEEDLWENQITKGGSTYERGFQEKYWLTKSKDRYPLLMWNMTRYLPNKEDPYTKVDIEAWLKLTGEDQAGED